MGGIGGHEAISLDADTPIVPLKGKGGPDVLAGGKRMAFANFENLGGSVIGFQAIVQVAQTTLIIYQR
jgi:hypothetical protein